MNGETVAEDGFETRRENRRICFCHVGKGAECGFGHVGTDFAGVLAMDFPGGSGDGVSVLPSGSRRRTRTHLPPRIQLILSPDEFVAPQGRSTL